MPNTGSPVAAWTQTFQYDGFGNQTAQVLNGTTTAIPVDASTNRLSSASYDSNGNMTSGVGATFTFDVGNRVLSAAEISGGVEYYGYAPDNRRIYKKLTSGAEEYTFFGGQGEKLGVYNLTGGTMSALRTNVWFGGKLISENSNAVFQDRVGTNRASGARFHPYGDEITSTTSDRQKFATYIRDGYTGLDYADQRYYASSYGRFNTSDPSGLRATDPESPASWNRYTYVAGDPISGSDPSGLDSTPTFCWDTQNGDGTSFVTCYDNDGPIQAQGNSKGRFLHVANPSKSGPNEQRIDAVLNWINNNIDPQCSGWLSGIGSAITTLEGEPSNPDSVYIGHGTYDVGIAAFTGSNPNQTDLPMGYAITVNDAGAFFTGTAANGANLSVSGYAGGTSQAQVFILLHEFGHLLSANGFQDDFGNTLAGNANNLLVKQNCQNTLNAATNIP